MKQSPKLLLAVGIAVLVVGFIGYKILRPRGSDRRIETSKQTEQPGERPVEPSSSKQGGVKKSVYDETLNGNAEKLKEERALRVREKGVKALKEFNSQLNKSDQRKIMDLINRMSAAKTNKDRLKYRALLVRELSRPNAKKALNSWGGYMEFIRQDSRAAYGALNARQKDYIGGTGPSVPDKKVLDKAYNETHRKKRAKPKP